MGEALSSPNNALCYGFAPAGSIQKSLKYIHEVINIPTQMLVHVEKTDPYYTQHSSCSYLDSPPST